MRTEFEKWYKQLEVTGSIKPLRFGMSRDDLEKIFGPPDAQGGTSRKYRTPAIYKYQDLEFFFEPWKAGGLTALYREGSDRECNLHITP